MSERLATLSIAVTLDASGNVTQLTHSTNAPDLTLWRQALDALWMQQAREKAKEEAERKQT